MRYSLGAVFSIALSQYITSTWSRNCGNTGGLATESSGGPSTSIEAAGGAENATTWTALDGKTIVSSALVIVIGGSETVALPSISSLTVLTAGGETFTLSPFSTSSNPPTRTSQSSASSSFSSGKDGTAISPTASSPIATTSNASTVPLPPPTLSATATLSSSTFVTPTTGIIIVGTNTIPVPTGQTTPVIVTTDGFTFTFPPPPLSATTTPSSITSVISTTGVIIVGTNTIPVPTGETTPVTLTTDVFTFTFPPLMPQSVSPTASPPMSPLSRASVVVIGTDSFSIPTGNTIPITTTKDGFTFTFPSVPQQTVTTSNGIIIIGTDSFPVPSGTTTVTRDGVTLTFPPKVLSSLVSETDSTTIPSTLLVLPTFKTWPPDASIIPVITDVPQPQYNDGKTETPCKIWFFWICVSWVDLNIHIGGWQWVLPPGIYPDPPPPGFIKLPPGMTISGSLPPWPTITIGQDHIPTYSSEPTECKTESVPFCAITTPASATAGLPAITSCTPILGCDIKGTTKSTTNFCSVSIVTNFVISCNTNSATSSCITISSITVSGCGKTAITSTIFAPACKIVPTNFVDIVEVTSETTIPTSLVTITPTGSTVAAPPTLTGLPELSSSSFFTPAGSACASSTVSSQCFGGVQDNCLPTTICASWIATTVNTVSSSFLSSTELSATMTTASLPTSSGTCDDKCKLDRGYPCNCTESGCDANSPACCASGNCPSCNCGESSCDANSPACCASGTCQWLTKQ